MQIAAAGTPTRDVYQNFILTDPDTTPFDRQMSYQTQDSSSVFFSHPALNGEMRLYMRFNRLHIHLRCQFDKHLAGKTVDYLAADPITRGYSYSGSGLPYPNAQIAYEGRSNVGQFVLDETGCGEFDIESPAAFYVKQGSILLNPHVNLYLPELGWMFTVDVGRPVRDRSLTSMSDRPNRVTLR